MLRDYIKGFIRESPLYLIAMAQETHSLSVRPSGNGDSAQVSVPADVQREYGICLDDQVEVAIHGVSGLIDQASFTGTQIAGDKVTIPADAVRQLELERGVEYEFSFGVPSDEVEGAIPDEELAEAVEEADEDEPGLGELFSPVEDEDEDEEESSDEELGELFG